MNDSIRNALNGGEDHILRWTGDGSVRAEDAMPRGSFTRWSKSGADVSHGVVRYHVADRKSEILVASGKASLGELVPRTHLPGHAAEADFGGPRHFLVEVLVLWCADGTGPYRGGRCRQLVVRRAPSARNPGLGRQRRVASVTLPVTSGPSTSSPSLRVYICIRTDSSGSVTVSVIVGTVTSVPVSPSGTKAQR